MIATFRKSWTAAVWATAMAVLQLPCASRLHAAISGPYPADANTIYLYHLDEPAGGSSAANAGSAGLAAISYDGTPFAGDGVEQTTVTTVFGTSGFSGFGNAANLSAANDLALGVDASGNGAFQLDDSDPISNDRQADHSSIFGTGNVFTLEAMINLPAITGSNREIIATDNASVANADRGFQFRVTTAGALEFNFIGPAVSAVSVPIPTSGMHGFVANEWFHAAVSHDGTNATFYWTRVDPAVTAANQIGAPLAEAVDVNVDMILAIGNEARVVGTTGSTEGLLGLIDEVRISNVVRAADQFIFSGPAGGVAGDYNDNDIVDAADFVLWRDGGPLANDPTLGVQPADYDFWRSRFGATTGSAGGSGAGQADALVPEPGAAALVLIGLWSIAGLRRVAVPAVKPRGTEFGNPEGCDAGRSSWLHAG